MGQQKVKQQPRDVSSSRRHVGRVIYAVEWLKQGVRIETETSELANVAGAVATTRARATVIAARHPSEEEDSFRLMDLPGVVLITFKFSCGRQSI